MQDKNKIQDHIFAPSRDPGMSGQWKVIPLVNLPPLLKNNIDHPPLKCDFKWKQNITYKQCDQIGRFIGLWATF